MSSSRGKKTAVLGSKKRKGAAPSLGPTTEIRHPFLQVPLGPQEELYQIFRARLLGVGSALTGSYFYRFIWPMQSKPS
ncbi:hypothetical protein GOBAR_AA09562 [Gossypium barbadense]|uniref:Uncharacterized protein n=1 Tax=Gossypium barbadense TaxID=3634 RepID=A0A2P5Y664_GOSBA|nr:hypothetical protein GOBAR_AA09562 [Gossypium barbadense]